MVIELPEHCPRGLDNCLPLRQAISNCGTSFICCGYNHKESRKVPQDVFRHCWKNDEIDEMSDWDRRDVIDTIAVLSGALSADENMRAMARTPVEHP